MKKFINLNYALPIAAVAVAAVGSAFKAPVKHAFTTTTYFVQTVGATQTLVASQTIPATGWNKTTTEPNSLDCSGTAHTCFVEAQKVGTKERVISGTIVPGIFEN